MLLPIEAAVEDDELDAAADDDDDGVEVWSPSCRLKTSLGSRSEASLSDAMASWKHKCMGTAGS